MNNTIPGTDIGLCRTCDNTRGISVAGVQGDLRRATRIEFENAATFNFAYGPETEPLIRYNWPKARSPSSVR